MANRINVVLGLDIAPFQRSLNRMQGQLNRFASSMQNAGRTLTESLTLPIAAIGGVALKSFADIEKLNKGLIAIMGSSEAAAQEFEKLREVARLPGLGLKEAVQGSINLQAVGLSADEARMTMLGFGKALAATGKGKVELESIQYQLTQMISKNKILAEDYKVIQSNLPLMAKGMEAAFGTNNIENIRATGISAKDFALRLSAALGSMEETQNVTGGLANAFENLQDSVFIAGAQFGEAINKSLNLEKMLGKVADAVQRAADWFSALSPGMQKIIVISAVVVAAIGPVLLIFGKMISVIPVMITGLKALGTAFTFMTGPVGIAIAVIGAIVAGVVYAYSKFEGFRRVINGLGNAFKEVFQILKEGGAAFVRAFGELKEGEFRKAAASIEEGIRKTNPVTFAFTEGKRLKEAFSDGFADNTNYLKKAKAEFSEAVSGGGASPFAPATPLSGGTGKRKPFEVAQIGDLGKSFDPRETLSAFSAVKGLDSSLVALKISLGEVDFDKLKFEAQAEKAKLMSDTLAKLKAGMTAGMSPAVEAATASLQSMGNVMEGIKKLAISTGMELKNAFQRAGDSVGQFFEQNKAVFQGIDAVILQSFKNRESAISSFYEEERARIEGSRMSEEQKASAMAALDGEVERRRKKLARDQAIREKALGLISAIVNTAKAVTASLPNIPLAAIVGALGAVQIGLIASQKLPALARGGMTTGLTTAIVGDNPSGKEAIIPFERMGEFLNMAGASGSTRLTGLFEVRGSDLILAVDRARQEQSRIR
jgi:tape measure domain-containing protein